MRTLSDIVRGRLKPKGWTQEQLADFLGMSSAHLSDVLNGKRAPPLEARADWNRWADGLDLSGVEAEELADALHMAAAIYYGPRVGRILEHLEAEVARLKGFEEDCRHRLRRARQALDLMDPPGDLRRVAESTTLHYDETTVLPIVQPPTPPRTD